jgi:hypothetical protein
LFEDCPIQERLRHVGENKKGPERFGALSFCDEKKRKVGLKPGLYINLSAL